MLALASRVTLTIRRYYFDNQCLDEKRRVTLHGFSDASKRAHAAVEYITTTAADKRIIGQFVACKTKVAPVKPTTIPRLELCPCLLLANLMSSVLAVLDNAFQVSEIYCWNDSLDSLFWIKEKHKKRNVFVENRVKSIRETVPSANWRFYPGNQYPAVLPSRGYEKEAGADQTMDRRT